MKKWLRQGHALIGEDGTFSHKIDFLKFFLEILKHKWRPNCITGSRVAAVLLNGGIWPIGDASAVNGLQSTGLLRLVYNNIGNLY